MKNKSGINDLLKICLLLVAAILAGTFLMFLVYCLPTGVMRENISRNIDRFYVEADYHDLGSIIGGSVLDNYTDSLMYNTAIYEDSSSVFHKALTNPHATFANATSRSMELCSAVQLTDQNFRGSETYSRYWHGYLVILKPLLLFFSPAEIRQINLWAQMAFIFMVLIALYKAAGYRLALPYLLMLAVINPVSTAMSLQFSPCLYLTLAGTLLLLKNKSAEKDNSYTIFLILGIGTAFFDLLTYPLISLGVNLIICLVLSGDTLKENLKKTLFSSVSWFFGYAGMWAGKWVVASLFSGENVIQDAISSVLYRMAGDSAIETGIASTGLFSVLWRNITVTRSIPLGLVIFVIAIYFLVRLEIRKEGCLMTLTKNNLLPIVLVALYPILWYVALQNHSFIHFWMTYREMAILIFALACIISHLQFTQKKTDETPNQTPEATPPTNE